MAQGGDKKQGTIKKIVYAENFFVALFDPNTDNNITTILECFWPIY